MERSSLQRYTWSIAFPIASLPLGRRTGVKNEIAIYAGHAIWRIGWVGGGRRGHPRQLGTAERRTSEVRLKAKSKRFAGIDFGSACKDKPGKHAGLVG